jgi:hypothetical protein
MFYNFAFFAIIAIYPKSDFKAIAFNGENGKDFYIFCAFGASREIRPFPPHNIYAIIPLNPHPERFWKYAQWAKRKNYKSNKCFSNWGLG